MESADEKGLEPGEHVHAVHRPAAATLRCDGRETRAARAAVRCISIGSFERLVRACVRACIRAFDHLAEELRPGRRGVATSSRRERVSLALPVPSSESFVEAFSFPALGLPRGAPSRPPCSPSWGILNCAVNMAPPASRLSGIRGFACARGGIRRDASMIEALGVAGRRARDGKTMAD